MDLAVEKYNIHKFQLEDKKLEANKSGGWFGKKIWLKFRRIFHQESVDLDMNSSSFRAYNDIMKYPLLLMRLLGLYHQKKDGWFLKAYPLAVIIFLLVGLGRFLSLFEFWYGKKESTADLIYKIITTLWCFIAVITGTIFFINQEFNSRDNKLVEDLSHFLNFLYSNKNFKKLKIRIYVYYICGAIAAILNLLTGFFSIFEFEHKSVVFSSFLDIFNNQAWSNDNLTVKILNRFLMAYESFFWVFTIDYFLSQCDMLEFIFRNLSLDFQNLINKDKMAGGFDKIILPSFEQEFNQLRKHFFKLNKVVQQMDKCYNHLIGISILVYLAMILLLFYIMTLNNKGLNGVLIFLYPYWTLIAFVIILLIVVNGTKFHEHSSNILENLLEICNDGFSENFHFKVYLMVNKLTNNSPCLTVLGLINIKREFILTLFGSLLSYYLVASQFKDSKNAAVNCQNNFNSTN
ncbi:odorant gustatory chemosensory receptor 122-like protein [Brachionus plicatilis]|uniref:Odorant gustatory chemosensory receptor 122-like protein n=1 Tax=Brachionus plicatilis TaxID=10195 RepID=A0A3M7Q1D6_BRAPC|nr:odorant gustatory chemosensory receptor 122-like protein [Brachionus plicatilis]